MPTLSTAVTKRSALALSALLTVGSFAGCTENKTRPVDVDSDQGLVSKEIDPQDFQRVAAKLTQEMLNNPGLQQDFARDRNNRRKLIKISRFVNNTDRKINMVDYLVTPIEQEFVNSGKVAFFSEDKTAQDISAGKELLGEGRAARLPDFTLYGTVSKLSTADAGTRQNTYTFQLRLARTDDGEVAFVGNKNIGKQFNR
jgi:PBP1b-binding outer membrane lipoprotein LpoB